MEFAKRIGELSHLARRLSRVQADEARARRLLASARSLPDSVEAADEVGLLLSSSGRRARGAAAGHRDTLTTCVAVQNQLLQRRIPLAVSLVERSWWKLECRQRQLTEKHRPSASSSKTLSARTQVTEVAAASPAPTDALTTRPTAGLATPPSKAAMVSPQQLEAVRVLLQHLHGVEGARRRLLQAKERTAEQLCRTADEKRQHFQREFSPLLRPRRRALRGDSPSEADMALLRETAAALQQRSCAAKDDVALMRRSLLARPLLSARLWRLLLRQPLWAAAVAEHKQSSAQPSTAAPRLLLMCTALTRLSMGVLRDYVEGRSFSRSAPRFVVSLPSRTWTDRRSEMARSGLDDGESDQPSGKPASSCKPSAPDVAATATSAREDEPEEDALFAMLQETARASPPISATRNGALKPRQKCRRAGKDGVTSMQWLPPHTAEVLPLVAETLALHSLVLPELDVPTLLQRGCATELTHLCVTLQRMASTALALAPPFSATLQTDASGSSPALQPDVLRRLESALSAVGRQVRDDLVAASSAAPASTARPPSLAPAEAAQLAAHLDSLRLLPAGNADAAHVLSQLLLDMFPELRTRTSRVLQEKARQSSLLAFATRPHRLKLATQHGSRNAEGYVLGTIIQQARLQQRQLSAALRDKHLTEVHVQQLGRLAAALSTQDLVRLVQLCARHVSDPAATSVDATLTGSLFLAEALLISGALRDGQDSQRALSLQELALLWDAAAQLFSQVRRHRSEHLQLQQHQRQRRGQPRAPQTVHTESVIWATFAEHVLASASGALAQRLDVLQQQRRTESTAMRRHSRDRETTASAGHEGADGDAAQNPITVDVVVGFSSGILEYAAHDDAVARTDAGSVPPVQRLVRVLARLLQELVLHDRELWHAVRTLPATQRDAVERQLLECFQTMGVLDAATSRALESLQHGSRAVASS